MTRSPLVTGFCRGVRPPPEEPLREWVCQHVYLPNSPEGARYSLEAVPAHEVIWDWMEDPEVKEIAVVACVGFGKTAIIEGIGVRAVAVDHGDMLVIGQTGKMVQDWMESRMRKVWELSPLTNPHIPRGAERSNWKKESVIFRHMNFFAGSANETDLQEKSMVYTVGDEVWRWDDGMIDFLLKRHHGRWNRKNILLSQGGGEDSQWHNHARAGKWYELEHVCPHCTTGTVFDWNNFQYEKTRDANEEFDWVAIMETVRLKCPHCGTEFEDTEFNRRQWAKCRPVYDGAKHIPGRMTLRASFMTVWRYQWRDIIKEWIIANEEKKSGQLEKLENIVCQRFAQFWKRPSDTPILTVMGDPYSKQEYHEGQKWEMEDFRFLTVDVQQSHFWAIVSAWKIGGDSRVIWEGRLETWDNVRYLQERYTIENRFVFVDCGYRQELVARECLKAPRSNDMNPWNMLKGEDVRDGYMKAIGEKRFRRPYSDYTNIQSSDGMRYRIIRFSNLMCKDRLATLMETGSFGVPTDASKSFHVQMQSEQRREVSPGVWRWVPVRQAAPNHLWDCSVMQIVAACLFKVLVGAEEVRRV